jgi:hypothetical protein
MRKTLAAPFMQMDSPQYQILKSGVTTIHYTLNLINEQKDRLYTSLNVGIYL